MEWPEEDGQPWVADRIQVSAIGAPSHWLSSRALNHLGFTPRPFPTTTPIFIHLFGFTYPHIWRANWKFILGLSDIADYDERHRWGEETTGMPASSAARG